MENFKNNDWFKNFKSFETALTPFKWCPEIICLTKWFIHYHIIYIWGLGVSWITYDAVGLKGCGGAEGHKLVKCEVQKGTNLTAPYKSSVSSIIETCQQWFVQSFSLLLQIRTAWMQNDDKWAKPLSWAKLCPSIIILSADVKQTKNKLGVLSQKKTQYI